MANEIYHRSNWGNAVNDKYWADVYEKYSATNKMFVRSDYYENSNETDKLMADIYPKPSILLTPTAYDNGSLHSVKPVKTFGSELVTNGDFATDSDWTITAGEWVIADGKASIDSNAFTILKQDVSLNGNLVVNVDISEESGSGGFIVVARTFDNSYRELTRTHTANESYSEKFTFHISDGIKTIEFWRENPSFNTVGSIDNVSVKEVIDADFDFTRGSSATRVNEQGLIEDVQILSGELVQNGDFEQIGSELITNGTFDTDTDWTKGTGWNIANGKASNDGSVSGNDYLINSASTSIVGKTYKVVFTISDYVQGSLRVRAGQASSTYINANGTYTQYQVSTSTETVRVQARDNFIGSIDNVSVKEVGQNWTFGTGWSIGDGVALHTGSTGNLITNASLTINKLYKVQFEIVSIADGVCNIYDTGSATTYASFTTIGLKSVYITKDSSNALAIRSNSSNVTIDNISVIEITEDTDLPRIDYTDGTGSLLLEPQSTNLVIDSSGGSYGNNPASEILTTAPDGTNTAVRPVPDSTSDRYQYSVAGGSYATDSKLTYAWYRKRISTPSDTSFVGDLEIKALVNCTQVGSTTQIQTNVNGFDRFEAVFNIVDGSLETLIRGYFGKSIGVGNSSIAYWGHQVEALSYATSYIPTSGSTVTRLADVCNNAGSSDLINSTEGVLYAEISGLSNPVNSPKNITISDGTASNYVRIEYYQDGKVYGNVYDGTSVAANFVVNQSNFNKIAIQYSSSGSKLYVNGVGVDFAAKVFTSNILNTIQFSSAAGNSSYFEGKVKCVAVFKEALNNDQLERLTGEGYETFNLLAQANNYTII
jgi:hypothetical protein